MYKKILVFICCVFLVSETVNSQGVISCVPCDMLGMSVNVGSQETAISIYHSGQYMTHPQEYNVFIWEFSDQQGSLLHQDTLVDDSTISFGHNWSLSDTINVKVHLKNDSANLDNWYINQGLPTNGNSISCLFEDQLYWEIDTFPNGITYGMWTFIHNNPGVDINTLTVIDDFFSKEKTLIRIVDLLGREFSGVKNIPLFYIYDNGTVEKKIIIE